MAYIAAVASHPAFTARFQKDLSTPGLRIPMTVDRGLFEKAVGIGRAIVWLQTFGERMADPARGRPAGAPRLPPDRRPMIPKEGAIPIEPDAMPDEMSYDATKRTLRVGAGFVKNVDPAVWNYQVSGKRVLLQWFSYRKKNREHPLIGDRRPPSPLGDIQPDRWLPEYTNDLIDVLNVLRWLVDLEPAQTKLLESICAGPTISAEELHDAGAFELPADAQSKPGKPAGPSMFSEMGLEG
jgi:Type ISP C-terminal specificity domain